jgi:hypothetical protein
VLLLTSNMSDLHIDRQELPWPVHVAEVTLLEGPYLIETITGRMYMAGCRYEDTHAAFVSEPTTVQSRLHHNPTQGRPLAGVSVPACVPTLNIAHRTSH